MPTQEQELENAPYVERLSLQRTEQREERRGGERKDLVFRQADF